MKSLLLVSTLFIGFTGAAQNFQKIFGGSGTDRGTSVVATFDGGYAIAGYTTSFGAGGEDFYIIKVDSFGSLLWEKTFGGTGDEGTPVRVELAQTPDSGFLLGGSTGSFGATSLDGYIGKLDANGNFMWEYKYSTPNGIESIHEFKFLSNGDILAIGSDNQDNFGSSDALMIRLSSNGTLIWSRVYGGSVNDSFGGVTELPGGNLIAAGSTSSYGPGTYGGYMVKMNDNGILMWDYSYGGLGIEGFSAATYTNDNHIIITGPTGYGSGDSDVLLAKLDTNGVVQWSKAYGGTNFDRGVSVSTIPNSSDLYVACLTQSYNNGDYDIMIMRVDPLGNIIWSKVFGTDGSDQIHIWGAQSTLQATGDGGFVFTGWSDSLSIGGDDIIFIKGDSLGSILCTDVAVNTVNFTLPRIDPTSNQTATGSFVSIASFVNVPAFMDSSICYCVDPTVCAGCTVPIAFFAADTTNGLSIQFTDLSSDGETWFWNFGDGYLSTLQDPIHNYSSSGTYTVCLIVTNTCGSDTICSTIDICDLPVAEFFSTENVNTIQFTDQSTNVTSWQWDFGDGTQSTDQNPSHAYAGLGTYTVCLITTNGCGTDTICHPVCTCEAPVADFETDTTIGTSVQFTNTSLGATSWFWDFGDGDTSNIQNPGHVYAATGLYTACLIVYNNCSSDTACVQINVCDQPVANFVIDSMVGTTVTFSDLSTNTVSWQWDFGDGNQSTNQNPLHNYAFGGWYDVCLIATNDCGSDTLCEHIFIDGPSGLLENNQSWFIIYPNPSSDYINLAFTNGNIPNYWVEVYNAVGKIVYRNEFLNVDNWEINISDWAKGLYLIKVEINGLVKTVKFLKE